MLGCSEVGSADVEVAEGSVVAGVSEGADGSDDGVADVVLEGARGADCVVDRVGVADGGAVEVGPGAGPGAGPSVGCGDGVGEVMTALSVQATQQ